MSVVIFAKRRKKKYFFSPSIKQFCIYINLRGDFSQTSAHLGFSQSAGRWHFQSQSGSSQTDSQAGVGFVHSVWQAGSLQTVSHLGQAPFSQCLTGQRTSHSGLSHLIAHLLQPNSWQRVEQRGCSQIGSQTWLQTGDEHFHWHLGWQSLPSPQSPDGSAQATAFCTLLVRRDADTVAINVHARMSLENIIMVVFENLLGWVVG